MINKDKKLMISSAYGGVGITLKIGREQVVLDYEEVIKLKEVIDAEFDVQLEPLKVHEIVGTTEEKSFTRYETEHA